MERAGGGKYVTRESGRLPPPGAGLVHTHTHTHTHTNQPTSKVVPIVNLLLDAKKKNDKANNWASKVDGGTPVSVCGYRSLFEYIVHADVRRQNTPSRRDEKIGLLFFSLSLEFLHQRGARQGARVHTPVPGGLVTWPRSRRRRLGIIAASHGQGRGTGTKPCTPTLLTRKKKSTKQPDVAHPSGNEEEEKVLVVVVVVVVPNWS